MSIFLLNNNESLNIRHKRHKVCADSKNKNEDVLSVVAFGTSFFSGASMALSREDEKWLKKSLKECFARIKHEPDKKERLLEGFSMLVRNMVRNIENELDEIKRLWEKNPGSKELRQRFESLSRCLSYLEKYCREKIGGELPPK